MYEMKCIKYIFPIIYIKYNLYDYNHFSYVIF